MANRDYNDYKGVSPGLSIYNFDLGECAAPRLSALRTSVLAQCDKSPP